MPVAILDPDSVVSAGSWSGVTAANLSDDNDGTICFETDGNSTFLVGFGNLPGYAATVNSLVSMYRYNRQPAWSGTLAQLVDRSGVGQTVSAYRTPAVAPSFSQTSESLACPGGSYTVAIVNALRGGCNSNGGPFSESVRVTKLEWSVSYNIFQGGYVLALLDLLPPVILAGLVGGMARLDVRGLAGFARRMRGSRGYWRPDEDGAIESALRGYRWPRHFDFGNRTPAGLIAG